MALYTPLVGGFNPSEKYWSKWESSTKRDEHEKYLSCHHLDYIHHVKIPTGYPVVVVHSQCAFCLNKNLSSRCLFQAHHPLAQPKQKGYHYSTGMRLRFACSVVGKKSSPNGGLNVRFGCLVVGKNDKHIARNGDESSNGRILKTITNKTNKSWDLNNCTSGFTAPTFGLKYLVKR